MNGQAERPDDELVEVSDVETDEVAAGGVAPGGADAEAPESSETALANAEAKANENWEKYLRAAAETDNVRKRAVRDVEHAHKFALERISKELLAVKDTLELGLESAENASVESLLEGSEATLKLLSTTMEKFGIEVVDPAGEPFDPEFHEAVSMQPSDAVEPGSVVMVLQKGYTLNGRLLRPALVIVAEK
jgi:molecular chaperone GrpE